MGHWRLLGLGVLRVLPALGASSSQPAPPESYLKEHDIPLDDLAYDAHVSSIDALAAASDARSVAGETSARASAENAASMEYSSQTLAKRTEQQAPFLRGTLQEAQKQRNMALVARKGGENAYNTAVLMQQEAIKNAASWATQETDRQLADPERKLQEWKMAVLHDPAMESRKAAAAAAAPYDRSLNHLHQMIMEVQQRAESMQSQGYALQQEARDNAKKAVGKQAGGHGIARELMKQAHMEMKQGIYFVTAAKKLWDHADDLYKDWGDYHAQMQHAAMDAAHRFAPHLFAPPPSAGSTSAIPGGGPPGPLSGPPGGYRGPGTPAVAQR